MNEEPAVQPVNQQAHAKLKQYFDCARKVKCPVSMKENLYKQISSQKPHKTYRPWFPARLVVAGLSLVFITSVIFKTSNNHPIHNNTLLQAQADLQLAMHYMNRLSFKSLSAVNNQGIKPGLIVPLAKSVATL